MELHVFNICTQKYRRGSNGFITEKTILFQGSRGGPTFSRGEGGVQILISIEPYITCDLPGGGLNTEAVILIVTGV